MQDLLRWIASARGIETEEGAALRLELAALPAGGLALLLLAGTAAALLFIWAVYRRDAGRLPPGRRATLAVLRCLAVLTLVAVLLEPSLVVVRRDVRPGHTILLLDRSLSMDHRDSYLRSPEHLAAWNAVGVPDPAALARMELARHLLSMEDRAALRALGARNRLHVYTFDGALHEAPKAPDPAGPPSGEGDAATAPPPPVGAEHVDLEAIEAVGAATNVHDSVRTALERSRDADVAAFVLLTDGRRNAGLRSEEAGRLLRQRKVDVVLAVGIGDPAETMTVEVADLEGPEKAFQKDPFTLRARIAARGYRPVTLAVRLLESREDAGGERLVDTRSVTVGGDQPEVLVEFPPVTADTPGRRDYRVEVDPPAGELPDESRHRREHRVDVLSEQTRVLLMAGGPTYEYQILRNLLIRDRTIDVSCWLQSADPRFTQDGNTVISSLPVERAELDEYDVVVLMDPDATPLPGYFAENLARQILEQGTGLLLVAGEKHTYPAWLETSVLRPVMEILPVVPDLERAKFEHGFGRMYREAWGWEPTPAGRVHRITRLVPGLPEANELFWSRLPGHHWAFRVARAKPAAEVLAVHSNPERRTSQGPEPILAVQFVGAGRVFFSATDETYRWRSIAEDQYNEFWIRAIRYLYEGRALGGASRFRISVPEGEVEIGEEVRITVRAQTETFQPLDAPEVRVLARSEKGAEVPLVLPAVEGRLGVFETGFRPTQAGLWEFAGGEVENGRASAVASLRVVYSQAESHGPMDRQELEDFARAAGGRFVLPDRLVGALADVPSREMRQTLRTPHPVWDGWVTLALLVLLLSLEWWLRKRANLV